MPQKRTTKKTTARKTAAPAPVRKAVAPAKAPADVLAAAATEAVDVCPRCGTTKFGPEQRTRVDGNRTVRFTILVCERGHTFAKPVRR
jgi:hypothetical protein